MNIEIHQPRLEALIHQRMASGHFESVEDLLLQTLEATPQAEPQPVCKESLEEMFAKVRGLFAEGELDFSRDPSPGRPVDLS